MYKLVSKGKLNGEAVEKFVISKVREQLKVPSNAFVLVKKGLKINDERLKSFKTVKATCLIAVPVMVQLGEVDGWLDEKTGTFYCAREEFKAAS